MEALPGFLKIVNDAKSRIQEADFREVKQWMDNRQEITLVDVREESEWARGHLPGAVHSAGVIERDIEGAFPDKDSRLVLYCGGGLPPLQADNLQQMGYTNVVSMDGGWRGWTEAGFPVDKLRIIAQGSALCSVSLHAVPSAEFVFVANCNSRKGSPFRTLSRISRIIPR